MLDFIKKSPFGFLLAIAGVVLVASPEAREALRKTAVKATAAVLDFTEKTKNTSTATTIRGYIPGETGETAPVNPTEANPS